MRGRLSANGLGLCNELSVPALRKFRNGTVSGTQRRFTKRYDEACNALESSCQAGVLFPIAIAISVMRCEAADRRVCSGRQSAPTVLPEAHARSASTFSAMTIDSGRVRLISSSRCGVASGFF